MNPLANIAFVITNRDNLINACTNVARGTVYSALQEKTINVHVLDSKRTNYQIGMLPCGIIGLAGIAAAIAWGAVGLSAAFVVPSALVGLGSLVPLVILGVFYYKHNYQQLTQVESRELFNQVENYMASQVHLQRACDSFPFVACHSGANSTGNFLQIYVEYFGGDEAVPIRAVPLEQQQIEN